MIYRSAKYKKKHSTKNKYRNMVKIDEVEYNWYIYI